MSTDNKATRAAYALGVKTFEDNGVMPEWDLTTEWAVIMRDHTEWLELAHEAELRSAWFEGFERAHEIARDPEKAWR